MIINNQKIGNKGLTLIELLVAITIFMLVIGSTIGLFISSIRSQAKLLATQKLLDETSYALEYMSRFLRMAVRDTEGNCVGTAGKNYYVPLDGLKITFLNYGTGATPEPKCQEFSLSGGQLKVITSGDATNNFGSNPLLPFTSGNLSVKSAQFKVTGDTSGSQQPRVTIVLEITRPNDSPPKIRVQTTISQRNFNVAE